MVDAESPRTLLSNLENRVKLKDNSISAEDFLQILNQAVDQPVRIEVYDYLEGLSKYCDWDKKKEEILNEIELNNSEEGAKYLKNQLHTVNCLRTAEKHKLNKPNLVEVEHEDKIESIKIEKKKTIAYVVDSDIIDKTVELYSDKKEDTAMIILGSSEYKKNHKLGSLFAQVSPPPFHPNKKNIYRILSYRKLIKNLLL